VLGIAVMRGVFTLAHNYLAESIGQSFGYELRLAFFEKLQRLSFSYHDRIHSGDLITRGMLDIEGVRRFIETSIMRLFQLAVLVGLGAWLYMGQDLVLGLLCLSFVPFAVWRGTVFRLRVRALWRDFQERNDDLRLLRRDGPRAVVRGLTRHTRLHHDRRTDAVPGVHDGAADAGAADVGYRFPRSQTAVASRGWMLKYSRTSSCMRSISMRNPDTAAR